MLLEVEGLCVNYGRIEAIRDISFGVPEGSVVTLIGANGAGKTTTMKTASGLRPVRAGQVVFEGRDITHKPAHQRVELGITQSPGGRGVFPGMPGLENLEMGAYPRKDRKAPGAVDRDRVYTLFPRLKERAGQAAGTMSGGEQQMLAIGRALMGRPKLLLLDEPSMGIAPILVERIYQTIAEINKQGTTILLVEQNANYALGVSHRGYVLETGSVALSDASASLRENPEVQKAYLGA